MDVLDRRILTIPAEDWEKFRAIAFAFSLCPTFGAFAEASFFAAEKRRWTRIGAPEVTKSANSGD